MNRKLDFEDLHRLKQSDIIDYFSFYDMNGEYLDNVANISVCANGKFGELTIIDNDGEYKTYSPSEYNFTRETVYVLGIGFLIPGDIVKLHLLDKRFYEIQYGWHTNVSNQTIHSWYLIPIDYDIVTKEVVYRTDSDILTLYKEHLETIEVVEFRKNRTTFYQKGEPV